MRNPRASLVALALLMAALTNGSAALADVHLVAAMPVEGSTASAVRALSLSFSEPVVDQQSGIELVMTGMPGMASHAPMKLSGFETTLTGDGRMMKVIFPRALPAGAYTLRWHVVAAAGGGRSEGQIRFSAR